jgi:tRNA-splicing ligase RtcB
MPREIAPTLLSWASELDDLTIEQAARTARLPILAGPVALMPDAHLGTGATIGSVIPTGSAVIPSGGRCGYRLRHGGAASQACS